MLTIGVGQGGIQALGDFWHRINVDGCLWDDSWLNMKGYPNAIFVDTEPKVCTFEFYRYSLNAV